MTDIEKLEKLFAELEIGWTMEKNDLLLQHGDEKIRGYLGFVTQFSFDDDGKFIEVCIFE